MAARTCRSWLLCGIVASALFVVRNCAALHAQPQANNFEWSGHRMLPVNAAGMDDAHFGKPAYNGPPRTDAMALFDVGSRVQHAFLAVADKTEKGPKIFLLLLGCPLLIGLCLATVGASRCENSQALVDQERSKPSENCSTSPPLSEQEGSQPSSVQQQLDVALRFFHTLRGEHGMYKDKVCFDGGRSPLSTAATGFGLVALTMMVERKLLSREEALLMACQTLQSIEGTENFKLERSANGFMARWPDDSGYTDGEISTIDTAILVLGTIFAANYFADPGLHAKVKRVALSVRWADACIHEKYGPSGMYLTMKRNGGGNGMTLPFNEYYLLAFCGSLVERVIEGSPGAADAFFKDALASAPAGDSQRREYNGIELLTDHPERYLPSFIAQFCFYLSGHYATSPEYRDMTARCAKADRLYWSNAVGKSPCPWGCGAGAYPANYPWDSLGYKATAIEDNEALVYSAPIVAGFLSFRPEAVQLLEHWHAAGDACKYTLPSGDCILWRASERYRWWRAPSVEAVDFATFFLGCGFHVLGEAFFDRCRANF